MWPRSVAHPSGWRAVPPICGAVLAQDRSCCGLSRPLCADVGSTPIRARAVQIWEVLGAAGARRSGRWVNAVGRVYRLDRVAGDPAWVDAGDDAQTQRHGWSSCPPTGLRRIAAAHSKAGFWHPTGNRGSRVPEAEKVAARRPERGECQSWRGPRVASGRDAGSGGRTGRPPRPGRLRQAHDPLCQAHVPGPCDQFQAKPCKQAKQYCGGAGRDSRPEHPARHRRPPPPGPARPGRQGRKAEHRPDRMRQRAPGMLRIRCDQHARRHRLPSGSAAQVRRRTLAPAPSRPRRPPPPRTPASSPTGRQRPRPRGR